MIKEKLKLIWDRLYPETDKRFEELFSRIEKFRSELKCEYSEENNEWFTEAVAYTTYVNLFAEDFSHMKDKLSYLEELGVNILWLLPVMDSPMNDDGFDVRDYESINKMLLGDKGEESFNEFVRVAREKKIRIIFDVPLNHCSKEHPLFVKAAADKNSPERDYFIWSKTGEEYSDARVIMKGLSDSNWEFHKESQEYYLHRFFSFQPDFNYRNPDVLEYFVFVFAKWKERGISGFRLDAIPYLYKEDGTKCENHPMTHQIIKFLRMALDYISPGNLFLAEACQSPDEVVEYFGEGDECHAAYHFPLMPMIFLALAEEDGNCIENILSEDITPPIPDKCTWFTFLRCHDELSLEMVTPEQRKILLENYCHEPLWNFRLGEGISARLFSLLKGDPQKILLAYSILFSLPGVPLIYYGDEIGMENDMGYYRERSEITGNKDGRFLCRGKFQWNRIKNDNTVDSLVSGKILSGVKNMIRSRKRCGFLGKGDLEFLEMNKKGILAFSREYGGQKLISVNNLTPKNLRLSLEELGLEGNYHDFLTSKIITKFPFIMEPYSYLWLVKPQ